MAITNMLQSKLGGIDNNDTAWHQYVLDHLSIIRDRSILYTINNIDMFRYKYRPLAYLDLLNINRSYAWIMLLVNHIDNNYKFIDMKYIFIPDLRYIDTLYDQFEIYRLL